mgnify:CR=1 FL=1
MTGKLGAVTGPVPSEARAAGTSSDVESALAVAPEHDAVGTAERHEDHMQGWLATFKLSFQVMTGGDFIRVVTVNFAQVRVVKCTATSGVFAVMIFMVGPHVVPTCVVSLRVRYSIALPTQTSTPCYFLCLLEAQARRQPSNGR